jgi:hypothetical protein
MWERAGSRKRFISHIIAERHTAFAGKPAPTGFAFISGSVEGKNHP